MSNDHETKSDVFYLRVEPSVKQLFNEAAAHYPGTPSDVLRWLIERFIKGHVTVTPTTHKE